jgi:hypothetical protein
MMAGTLRLLVRKADLDRISRNRASGIDVRQAAPDQIGFYKCSIESIATAVDEPGQ